MLVTFDLLLIFPGFGGLGVLGGQQLHKGYDAKGSIEPYPWF